MTEPETQATQSAPEAQPSADSTPSPPTAETVQSEATSQAQPEIAGPDFATITQSLVPPSPPVPNYYMPPPPQVFQTPTGFTTAPAPSTPPEDFFTNPDAHTRRIAAEMAQQMVAPVVQQVAAERQRQTAEKLASDWDAGSRIFQDVVQKSQSYKDPNVQQEMVRLVRAAQTVAVQNGDGRAFRDPRFFAGLLRMAEDGVGYRPMGSSQSVANTQTQSLSGAMGSAPQMGAIRLSDDEKDFARQHGIPEDVFLKNKIAAETDKTKSMPPGRR